MLVNTLIKNKILQEMNQITSNKCPYNIKNNNYRFPRKLNIKKPKATMTIEGPDGIS